MILVRIIHILFFVFLKEILTSIRAIHSQIPYVTKTILFDSEMMVILIC